VVEVDVERQRLLGGKRTYPTAKWRDPNAAGDPHLLVTTASVIEHSEGHAHTRWNTWLQGVDQTLRLIPQSLDREVKEGFLGSATDRKGMWLPPMSSPEAHKDKLPCYKWYGLGDRSECHLQRLAVQVVDRFNGVVVLPQTPEEGMEQFPVQIGSSANRCHRYIPNEQDRRVLENGVHQETVNQPGNDEQACQA